MSTFLEGLLTACIAQIPHVSFISFNYLQLKELYSSLSVASIPDPPEVIVFYFAFLRGNLSRQRNLTTLPDSTFEWPSSEYTGKLDIEAE